MFSPSTIPNSNSYAGPTGITVTVDSIVGDKLYASVNNPLNIDADADSVLDLTHLVDFKFKGTGNPKGGPNESDVNDDSNPADIFELNYLVNVIFSGGAGPASCS